MASCVPPALASLPPPLLPLLLLLLLLRPLAAAGPSQAPSLGFNGQRTTQEPRELPQTTTPLLATSSSIGTPAHRHLPDPEEEPPPPELFPLLLSDIPRLVVAGYNSLQFEMKIPCGRTCPTHIYWHYQVEGDSDWENRFMALEENRVHESLKAMVALENLKENTKYYIKAKPVRLQNMDIEANWYTIDKHAPFTPNISCKTCPRETLPVEDLRVHSTGLRWLALSWYPPKSQCLTEFEYQIQIKPDMTRNKYEFQSMGSFWSNASWAVKEHVMPCTAWPDRHCLLIQEDSQKLRIIPNKEYRIEMQVKRKRDNSISEKKTTNANATNSAAPGPPDDLRCVMAQPTKLHLRWRCPLSPGGILSHVNVRVTSKNKTVLPDIPKKVTLSSEYDHVVDNLQANEWYNIQVWFVTHAGITGQETRILVWTPPSEGYPSSLPGDPCKMHGSVSSSSQLNSVDGGGGGIAWGWCTICVVLLLLVVVALFVGRRWGSRGHWTLLFQDDSKSSSCGGAGASSSGDAASLCGAPLAQPSATPPSSVLEYAEVDVLSGRAWAANPRSPRHDYEELKSHVRPPEQPYAVVRDTTEAPPPYYTKVRPPPVASNPMPVYAQVDKKRAPPPPPPPSAHRQGLQESD